MLEGPLTWKLWILGARAEGSEAESQSVSAARFCSHLLVLLRLGCSGELEVQAHGGVKNAAVRRSRRQEHRQGAISLTAEHRRKD